ncbi:MAG TPA: VCBS repeat-containing protein [Acidobacteriaceae bacterium]|nr:VCBS repeat-containing protein [Acidobacteriaceae bacterium]
MTTSFPYAGFASAPKLETGSIPTAVAQGDFNEDGKVDIAISNGGDNTIYVYLGNGDGTFALPEVLYTAGQSPVWLAAAKLRATGHLDLIAVDGDSNQVEVFSGNGDGTFQQPKVVATLSQIPTFVVTGDFNNDGNEDLAVGLVIAPAENQPQFEVLLGDGTGAFPSVITPPVIDNPFDGTIPTSWLALGDLNKDGQLDVVTTTFGEGIAYLNQGGTAFLQGSGFGPVDGAVTVALGDVDNDGCLDAIETGGWGYLTIGKGNCDGTFTQGNPVAEVGDVDYAVAVADVNGDGKPDIVAAGAFTGNEIVVAPGNGGTFGGYLVSVMDGDGSGNFSPPAIYRIAANAFSLAVTDLKGNGLPDILTIGQTESTATHLVNDGKGGFGEPSGESIGYLTGVSNAPIPSTNPQTVDLNNDGHPDVVVIESGQLSSVPSQITALLNDGTGKLLPPVRSPITILPYAGLFPVFTFGKFRNSTTEDMILVSEYASVDGSNDSNAIAFIPGNGDGTFGAAVTIADLPDPRTVVSGDFNKDGKLDFAVFGYLNENAPATCELDIFLGNGDGTFKHLAPQTFTALTSDAPQQLIAGDFNHDGKPDLLIGNNTNNGWVASGDDLDLMLGNGDGTFQAATTLMSHFGPVAVADVNGDGYLDLIQARDPDANITDESLLAVGGPFIAPAITIYLGGPGGSFTKKATYAAPGVQIPSEAPPLVGDFNGDGKFDIAIPYQQSVYGAPWENRLQIFQGNGDGTFTPSGVPYQLPAYDLPIAGGDYRGVGVTDLLDLVGWSSSINTLSAAAAPAFEIEADSSPLTRNQGTATVTLALPASTSETVQLSSSDPAVTLPGNLTFSPGQSQQSFSFNLGAGFDASHLLAISATIGSETESAYFAKANPNLKPGVTAFVEGWEQAVTTISTSPGGSIQFLYILQSVDGYSGNFSQFSCSGLPAGASCQFAQPSATLLPGGSVQVAFSLNTTSSVASGTYNISLNSTNGEVSATAPVTLGIGGFSLGANPAIIQVNGASYPSTSVTASYIDLYSQNIQLSCNGLPSGATCTIPSILYPASPSTTVSLSASSSVAAQDYPFEITGTAGNLTATANATLRVSNFTAALETSSASLGQGQSASFNVEIKSLNHFSNQDISLSCQSSANVTCTTPSEYASVADGGSVTIPLKVTYNGSNTASRARPPFAQRWTPAWGCGIGFLLLLPKRRRKSLASILSIFIVLILLPLLSACGGGSNAAVGGGGTSSGGGSGTTSTVTVAVSTQAATSSGNLVNSAGTITLTVSN